MLPQKKNISKAKACQAKNYNLRHKGETLKVGDKIIKKNKKAEQRKGDKLGSKMTRSISHNQCP